MSLIVGALLALVIGALLLRQSQHLRLEMGLPHGEVFSQDHVGQPMRARTLVSRRYGLRGTPDCLIRTRDGIVPVELKRTAHPPSGEGVYPNHMIQVLAYCVLVEENYREPVPYGLVLYGGNEARKVYLTEDRLAWLIGVMDELRHAQSGGEKDRSHEQSGRCLGCGLREKCNQALGPAPKGSARTAIGIRRV
jgi:CRISPR/Cas system-associated exonuclease Cas4 (RecB family)